MQVSAAPKSKRDPQNDQSQRVEPETVPQKAAAAAATLLADASSARTSSIKLSNLEYAEQLSSKLLNHAVKLEELYTKITDDLRNGSDEKVLKKRLKLVNEYSEFGAKAQVGLEPKETNHTIGGSSMFQTQSTLLFSLVPCQAAADAFLKPKKKAKAKGKAKAKKAKGATEKSKE